jgi:hypothetical protein
MEPEAHDMWSAFRVTQQKLGRRILEILESQPHGRHTTDLLGMSGVVWLGKPAARRLKRSRAA